ncbi:MAG: SIS domain-containing protein [Sulfolobales archaeon]
MYRMWSEIISKALSKEVYNRREFRGKEIVYISGMGGSGIVGEYASKIIEESGLKDILVFSRRSSEISRSLLERSDKTFFILVSYSGNTGETLRVFRRIISVNTGVGVVTSGGILGEEALKRGIPMILIDKGLLPRVSFPMLLISVFKMIELLGVDLNKIYEEIRSAMKFMESYEHVAEEISFRILEALKSGMRIAIASTDRYQPLVERFATELAENSKILAERIVFPEAGHNFVETLEASKVYILYIEDPLDLESQLIGGFIEKISRRSESLKYDKLILPEGLGYTGRIIIGTYVGGLISAHLARGLGVDPVNTPIIKLYRDHVTEFYLTH